MIQGPFPFGEGCMGLAYAAPMHQQMSDHLSLTIGACATKHYRGRPHCATANLWQRDTLGSSRLWLRCATEARRIARFDNYSLQIPRTEIQAVGGDRCFTHPQGRSREFH